MIVPDDAPLVVVTGPSGDVVETTCVVGDAVVVVGLALGDDSMVSLAALGSFRYWLNWPSPFFSSFSR